MRSVPTIFQIFGNIEINKLKSMSRRPLEYGHIAKLLHWMTALLILALFTLGKAMTGMDLNLQMKFDLYQLHKSLGLTVFALTLLRILWRFSHPAPELPANMNKLERGAARLTHIGFYVLLLVLPLSGWLMVSASPLPIETKLYWRYPVPHLPMLETLTADQKIIWEGWFKTSHYVLTYTIAALFLLHVAGALRHHFFLGDEVFWRMWPRRKRKSIDLKDGPRACIVGAIAMTAICLASTPVEAEPVSWRVDMEKSRLTFTATANGQPVKGRFQAFEAKILFDPEAPEAADIKVTIDVAGITTGQSQIDAALKSPDWFDVATFPKARFEAKSGKVLDGERYQLTGTLTIRDKTKPITLPFTLKVEGKRAHVQGEVIINRTDYGVGQGAQASEAAVKHAVTIAFDLVAQN